MVMLVEIGIVSHYLSRHHDVMGLSVMKWHDYSWDRYPDDEGYHLPTQSSSVHVLLHQIGNEARDRVHFLRYLKGVGTHDFVGR